MKYYRSILSGILSIFMFCTFCSPAFAAELVKNDESDQYKLVLDEDNNYEFVGEISFADFDIAVVNDSQIAVTPKLNVQNENAEEQGTGSLQAFFDRYPQIEKCLASKISNGEEPVAVSYTDVPLKWVDDHYERYSSSDHFSSSTSQGADGNFLLYATLDYDHSYTTPSGEITRYYTVNTYGDWVKHSVLGGKDYPDAGYDYVHQTVPNTFSIESTSFSCRYDDNTSGTSSEYSEQDGGDSFTEYRVKDDPLGYKQLDSFVLTSEVYAPASASTRLVHSYYTHTWKSLTVTPTVSVNTNKEVQLSITPSIKENSWSIHNRLSFTM